ncbi:MAG: hypothetical protein PHI35_01895 [Victivallaceae bacterium]|nr:hypothetical protein [Victivallaceae bacterium]
MSDCGAFLRELSALDQALSDAGRQYEKLAADGLCGLSLQSCAETLRNQQLLLAQIVYLEAMKRQIADGVGSRGGALVISATAAQKIHPSLGESFRAVPENTAFRRQTLETTLLPGNTVWQEWVPVRVLPAPDGWFETVWKNFREKNIYGDGK